MTVGSPPVPPPPWWRQSWTAIASAAALALMLGWVAKSMDAATQARDLTVRIETVTAQREAALNQLRFAQERAARIEQELTRMGVNIRVVTGAVTEAQRQQQLTEMRLEQALKDLAKRRAKDRAGRRGRPAPAAQCRVGSVEMEFAPQESWPTCGQPNDSAYQEGKNIYWTVPRGEELKSCRCQAP